MQTAQVLDVVEALLRASGHPDIVTISRYGRDEQPGGQSPAGVRFGHQTQSFSMLWAASESKPAPTPVPLPAQMPPPVQRPTRALVFLSQLLDIARPDVFRHWESVSMPGVHLSPCALRIVAQDGAVTYLRATSGCGPGGAAGEPAQDPFADYQIPVEEVQSWHLRASAVSAALG